MYHIKSTWYLPGYNHPWVPLPSRSKSPVLCRTSPKTLAYIIHSSKTCDTIPYLLGTPLSIPQSTTNRATRYEIISHETMFKQSEAMRNNAKQSTTVMITHLLHSRPIAHRLRTSTRTPYLNWNNRTLRACYCTWAF